MHASAIIHRHDAHLRNLWLEVDKNDDNQVTKCEMGIRVSYPFPDLNGRNNATLNRDLNAAFDGIDTNHDTVLDWTEFKASGDSLYTRNRDNPSEYHPLANLTDTYYPVAFRVLMGEMQAC